MRQVIDWEQELKHINFDLPQGQCDFEDRGELALQIWQIAEKLPLPSSPEAQEITCCLEEAIRRIVPEGFCINPVWTDYFQTCAAKAFKLGIAYEQIRRRNRGRGEMV